MRLALLQLRVFMDKNMSVQNASNKIRDAVRMHKPRLIVLPETFNCPYGTKYFRDYSEPVPNGPTSHMIAQLAKELDVYIVAGSMIEQGDNNALHNTCTVYDPNGRLIAKHRKMHLFDMDLKGCITFKESDKLTPGNQFTMVTIDGHKVGIGICHDVSFEEMAKIYRIEGCEMLIYPSAFHITTGPMYWNILHQARAVDNQLYVVTASPARDETADYVAYGHSMVVDPWGKIVKSAREGEEIVVADIDFSIVEQVRQQVPLAYQRRLDMYSTERKQ